MSVKKKTILDVSSSVRTWKVMLIVAVDEDITYIKTRKIAQV